MKFEKCCQLLIDLGCPFGRDSEYRTDKETGKRDEHSVNVFTNILLPFTAEEWCHLCMREGDNYLGGCCGNMSAMQDIINEIFREGGWVSCRDLEKFAQHAANHDAFTDVPFDNLSTSLEKFAPIVKKKWKSYSPWDKIACIWHIVRDYYGPEIPFAIGNHMSELEKSVLVLSNGLNYLSYDRVFGNNNKPDSQIKASRAILMHRLMPAIKTLNEHIAELNLGPIEGYALIDKEQGPNAIATNGYGYCIYSTKKEVNDILNQWKKNREEYKDSGLNRANLKKYIDETLAVRKVRVSMENGIEFLND